MSIYAGTAVGAGDANSLARSERKGSSSGDLVGGAASVRRAKEEGGVWIGQDSNL